MTYLNYTCNACNYRFNMELGDSQEPDPLVSCPECASMDTEESPRVYLDEQIQFAGYD